MALLVEPKTIVRRLTPTGVKALESAVGRAFNARCYEITVEHLLLALVESEDGDAARIMHHYGQDRVRLVGRLEKILSGLRTGNAGKPVFSASIYQLLEDAWTVASLEQDAGKLRSGHVIQQFISNTAKYSAETLTELESIPRLELKKEFLDLVAPSKESGEAVTAVAQAAGGGSGPGGAIAGAAAPGGTGENLQRFCENFTAKAKAGKIDPVFGRHLEIRQMVDILARRRKNNPIIVGEPGVGKTALVEGLAIAIIEGNVPEQLKNVELLGLDLGLLQAGAGVKGEFENRLKNVIAEVKASPKPIILFIDEAHTIIGAGGAQGGSDAANLLKPALARGELRTIAATTWAEYKKYFERDAALARRFQPVAVDEPSEENAVLMLRGLRATFEKAHGLPIRDESIVAAVKLSHRYISGRQLPDKAVDLLDTACARVKINLDAKPDELTDMEVQLQNNHRERDALERDRAAGFKVDEEAFAKLVEKIAKTEASIEDFVTRWNAEKDAVKSLLEARKKAAEVKEADEVTAARAALHEAIAAYDAVKGKPALVHADVDPDVIAKVVGDWTGIPVGKMQKDDVAVLLSLEERLRERVRGQEHAIKTVAETIRIAQAGINNPHQPQGVLLFVGPSGVGKTETAITLADAIFGGERFMTTINMSEFQEKHTVSRLIGSPPGYVGYGEGGVLSEAVRQRPYSVVLLDEVEKADLDVMNLFYQVFDKGSLSDGEGRHINFRNTIMILTSNLATDEIMKVYDRDEMPTVEEVVNHIRPILSKHFKPALLARMTVIPYAPISRSIMREITQMRLNGLAKRLYTSHKLETVFSDELVDEITKRCTEAETGARNVEHILRGSLIPATSRVLLERMSEGPLPRVLNIGLSPTGEWRIEFDESTVPVSAEAVASAE
ncbi:MAG: type VI secretion system ATPase TssH [Myxococcales bacterium]|nr:type VI secretion system ATPase TssH [Myxococcales bacterium]